MKPADSKWPRLVAAARSAPEARDPAAPHGFATRVAALALAPERARASLLERFSLRALGVAALLALGCVAANYSTLAGLLRDDLATGTEDPVAELLDLAS